MTVGKIREQLVREFGRDMVDKAGSDASIVSAAKSTAAALRAGQSIADSCRKGGLDLSGSVESLAAIIDGETGLPALLEFVADWRASFAGSADEVARQFVHEADALLARATTNPR